MLTFMPHSRVKLLFTTKNWYYFVMTVIIRYARHSYLPLVWLLKWKIVKNKIFKLTLSLFFLLRLTPCFYGMSTSNVQYIYKDRRGVTGNVISQSCCIHTTAFWEPVRRLSLLVHRSQWSVSSGLTFLIIYYWNL